VATTTCAAVRGGRVGLFLIGHRFVADRWIWS
jgi:hypothetical protein